MTDAARKSPRADVVGISQGIGPLEAEIIRAIASLDREVSVREVCDHVTKEGYFAYQGVLNCMNRLTQKRILSRTEGRGAYHYRLLIGLEELAAQVALSVHEHMGGDLDRVVCRLLHIDPDRGAGEIAALRARLQVPPPRTRKR
jgi:predicted transcriptional regulator